MEAGLNFDYGVTRSPAQILFGGGQIRAVGRVAARLGSRALICTDERLAALPVLKQAVVDLEAEGLAVEVFSETQPELPLDGVLACVERYREFNPDVIVGFGGGSCLDIAKVVSLLLTHGGPVSNYYGEFKVPGPVIPIIAIPTTAGTGSEVTPVAVLADGAREMKVGISSPELIPHTAICDPELTLSCPAGLTALSGADALTHAIEAFSARRRMHTPSMAFERVFVGKNALSDQFSLASIRAIFSNLQPAVSDGSNLEARAGLMLGATFAGLAFATAGTSAAHAIQYPLGALTHTPHGLGVAVLLPYAMEYNLEQSLGDYAEIARAIGVADPSTATITAARAAIAAVRKLFSAVGIPETISELGVGPDQISWIAERSLLAARLAENNPRALSLEGVVEILRNAMGSNSSPTNIS
jgi:alcohol dehydrogenase class IV